MYNSNFLVTITDDNCTITPLSPILLTASGGRLYNGMTNVMINCNCTNHNPANIIWYYSNGTSYPIQLMSSLDSPHVTRESGTLTIPRFNQLHEGVYYCWVNGSSFGSQTTLKMLNGE